MSEEEILLMEKTLHNLKYGADCHVDESLLPGMTAGNGRSMFEPGVGAHYTDELVTMIKKGFVCGPYNEPPLEDLRCNPLFAIEQKDKWRTILNMSYPEGQSFNDAIKTASMRKLTMASPRQVANLIRSVGQGAIMSKVDQQSAYKIIGTNPLQWRLQGFRWLGKYFIEIRLVFGSVSAVMNYDDFGASYTAMIKAMTKTNPNNIPRALDDQLCITASREENERFILTYLQVADKICLPMADLSDKKKAFLCQTQGTILGVDFDTSDMTWTLDDEKIQRYMFYLQEAKNKVKCSLKLLQKILGMINTVTLLCPILKCYKTPILLDLHRAHKSSPIVLSPSCVWHLHGWLNVLEALKSKFPLGGLVEKPPESAVCIISDAAGLSLSSKLTFNIGVGAAVFNAKTQRVSAAYSDRWDPDFISHTFDPDGKFIGNKTTTLEAMGLILPLYHNARIIQNKDIILQCDNIAVVYALEKGRSKEDNWASLFIGAILFVTTILQCRIWPIHCKRLSSNPAVVADLLTRDDVKGRNLVRLMKVPVLTGWPPSMDQWMKKPMMCDDFRSFLLRDFKDKIKQGSFLFRHFRLT